MYLRKIPQRALARESAVLSHSRHTRANDAKPGLSGSGYGSLPSDPHAGRSPYMRALRGTYQPRRPSGVLRSQLLCACQVPAACQIPATAANTAERAKPHLHRVASTTEKAIFKLARAHPTLAGAQKVVFGGSYLKRKHKRAMHTLVQKWLCCVANTRTM